jgi:hypothetical protein
MATVDETFPEVTPAASRAAEPAKVPEKRQRAPQTVKSQDPPKDTRKAEKPADEAPDEADGAKEADLLDGSPADDGDSEPELSKEDADFIAVLRDEDLPGCEDAGQIEEIVDLYSDAIERIRAHHPEAGAEIDEMIDKRREEVA